MKVESEKQSGGFWCSVRGHLYKKNKRITNFFLLTMHELIVILICPKPAAWRELINDPNPNLPPLPSPFCFQPVSIPVPQLDRAWNAENATALCSGLLLGLGLRGKKLYKIKGTACSILFLHFFGWWRHTAAAGFVYRQAYQGNHEHLHISKRVKRRISHLRLCRNGMYKLWLTADFCQGHPWLVPVVAMVEAQALEAS